MLASSGRPPSAERSLPTAPSCRMAADPSARLTRRQLELLTVMATGASYDEAGLRVGMRRQTVKNHMSGAYRRLHCGGLVEAFVVLGWLTPGAEREYRIAFDLPEPVTVTA